MSRPFYEFFAGGGMARAGLGAGWTCVFANDMDPDKCAAYRANYGGADLVEGDVADLEPAQLPGQADLAWASFPCQDLSLAGKRKGMRGDRSSAFWPFWYLMAHLIRAGRAPRTIVIENVVGLATSSGGADFARLCATLAEGGYRFDATVLDAAAFLPQSRPRLFVVAWRGAAPEGVRSGNAPAQALAKGFAALDEAARAAWSPLAWPTPPQANQDLSAVLEPAERVTWLPQRKVRALIGLMHPRHRAKLDEALALARADGAPKAGALFRRTRTEDGQRRQRAEIRFDLAGCLRTPAGGSSRQTLVVAAPDGKVRARLFTGREVARLMGLPDEYQMPDRPNAALKLAGDGVAAPVVRFLAEQVLEPLLDGARPGL